VSWSLKLFRIRGIDVKVHLTFVLILVWAAYRWGVGLGAGTTGAVFGVVVTLLLFVCVTLHELAHSFTAMRYGVTVRDITLLPIGGMAQMEKIPDQPAQELKMALAGPLTNLAIAAILIVICLPFGIRSTVGVGELFQMLGMVNWQGLVAYLVVANIALGLFNLVPAFPMDGGRVLRALLAMRLDYAKATAWAVYVGQGLAWLLGLYGVTSGSWTLLIIAVFIYIGAGQEGRVVEVKSVLDQMQVRQAMTRQVQVLSPGATLAQAVDITLQTFQTDFPVVEGERLVGLLAETDLVSALQKYGPEASASQVMRTDFPTAAPSEPLFDAQQRMSAARVRALPVVVEGRLAGLLTDHDINEAYRLLSASPRLLETGGLQEVSA
jgi:Zn-dependent protease/predicted transcriptional regulator